MIGKNDEIGLNIIEDRVHIHDLHATMLHCLGFDHTRLTYRHMGPDFRLTDVAGNVVKRILRLMRQHGFSRMPFVAACWLSLSIPLCVIAQKIPVKHRIMLAQYQGPGGNRLVEVSADGKLTWEHKVPSLCVIFQALPNGNIVYAYGGNPTGVREIDRQQQVVWSYLSRSSQVLGRERLPSGNTLLAEQGTCQVLEVNSKGEVVRTVKLATSEKVFHRQVRNIHRLDNGNILAAHEGEAVVREVTPGGEVVWEYPAVTNVFEALRLANGNTLIGCGTQRRIIEVTAERKVVWELDAQDVPEVNLAVRNPMIFRSRLGS